MAHFIAEQLKLAQHIIRSSNARPSNLAPSLPPSLPPASSRPDRHQPPAGVIYPPGQYPTPELPLQPRSNYQHIILRDVEYTSRSIQNALDTLGPCSTVYLPCNTRWLIHDPIKLNDHQELATETYPTDERAMALLEASENCRPHLLHAFGKTGVLIRNLILDGKREEYGFEEKGGGVMVQLGGHPSEHQVLDRCTLRNPRSWSCVQAFEHARNVRITNNRIGPAGSGQDVEELKWADGISYSARDGLVAGNLIVDATDGGIVVFGAPGTLITSNVIVTHRRLTLGAINMVDYDPNEGNYENTIVSHNTIVTTGNYLKIGIGQGSSVWWTPGPEKRHLKLRGALVVHNLITSSCPFYPVAPGEQGTPGTVGYGFPVGADVERWVCMDNVSSPCVVYSGDISSTVSQGYINAAPQPFVHGHGADATSITLQPEFTIGKVWGLQIAVKPGRSKVLGYDAGSFALQPGESIDLEGDVRVMFKREDAELCVVRSSDGLVLWIAGISERVHPRDRSNAALIFTPSGKLAVVNSHNRDGLHDLTPHIPHSPPRDNRPEVAPHLMLSSSPPFINVTSPSGDTLFSSSYFAGHQTEFKPGKRFFSRPTPHVGGALVYAMGNEGQFIVAHTRTELSTEYKFDLNCCNVVYVLGIHSGEDLGAAMIMQGDGNLVVYSGEGKPSWASGTCGDRAAEKLIFGIGTSEEPFLELHDRAGKRVWAST